VSYAFMLHEGDLAMDGMIVSHGVV
jgi:hypothetical protein